MKSELFAAEISVLQQKTKILIDPQAFTPWCFRLAGLEKEKLYLNCRDPLCRIQKKVPGLSARNPFCSKTIRLFQVGQFVIARLISGVSLALLSEKHRSLSMPNPKHPRNPSSSSKEK